MLMMILSLAWAGDPAGHYHPDDIASASTMIGNASANISRAFEAQASRLRKVAGALRQYREGLELMGDRASVGEWDRLGELEKQYHRDEAVLQAFADELVRDFDEVIGTALTRSLEGRDDPVRCRAELPTGPRVPGMAQRTKPNPECTGPNLNADLARAIDNDRRAHAAITEIMGLSWPEVTLDEVPQEPVGAGPDGWVSVRGLLAASVPGDLKAIDRQDDDLRLEIEAALEQEAPDLDALRARVAEIEQTTASARGELGLAVLSLAEGRMLKWRDGGDVGWCANPGVFGGCQGEPVTREVVERLREDRKFKKKLP